MVVICEKSLFCFVREVLQRIIFAKSLEFMFQGALQDQLICHTAYSKNKTNHEQLMARTNERTRRNIIKTLILVSLVFAVCWALNEVCYFYFNVSGNTHINETLYNVSVCLAYFNMCVNPIIYTFNYRQFQKGLRQAVPWRTQTYSSNNVRTAPRGQCSISQRVKIDLKCRSVLIAKQSAMSQSKLPW